ncbi:MAG: hypothetical protein VB817_11240, partial [Pirellulaceae bacterium]
REEVIQRAAVPAWWRQLPLLLGLLLVLGIAFTGYLLSWRAATADNRRFLEDLPVIEQVSEYRQAESVEFLRLLVKEGLFETAHEDGP